jgi:hypothetical protein
MLLYCWLALITLAPIAGCLLFVFLAENPTPLTAAAGAMIGMCTSLTASIFLLS